MLTPMDPNVRLTKRDSPEVVDPHLHRRMRSIVGCLSYLVNMTPPDLAFTYSQLSKFVQSPGPVHLAAAHDKKRTSIQVHAAAAGDAGALSVYIYRCLCVCVCVCVCVGERERQYMRKTMAQRRKNASFLASSATKRGLANIARPSSTKTARPQKEPL